MLWRLSLMNPFNLDATQQKNVGRCLSLLERWGMTSYESLDMNHTCNILLDWEIRDGRLAPMANDGWTKLYYTGERVQRITGRRSRVTITEELGTTDHDRRGRMVRFWKAYVQRHREQRNIIIIIVLLNTILADKRLPTLTSISYYG